MNDEAESAAGQRHANTSATDAYLEPDGARAEDAEEDLLAQEQLAKERRGDAKRKRVVFLEHLLRELDGLVMLELITTYHLDCSFFWFLVRIFIHVALLTPLPDLQINHQFEDHKPYMALILFCFTVNSFLHTVSRAPAAGEDTRGYLHGGLMIDFIGQEGPTSKWKLAGLDMCILVLQCAMVSVHVKRRELRRKLGLIAGGASEEGEASDSVETGVEGGENANADRDQDADSEERGVLRRSDTLSDMGADAEADDALLDSLSDSGPVDALDLLSSGQCVIGDFTLVDTLLHEHHNYSEYRRTRTESGAGAAISPSTLRQLHTIRVRFGVGGG